ncbi:gluconate 2-dehydrogenase [Maritalea myrionectae]|uniref:Gluconate 2-dehydrogenase n=1 Tax=Maritalea myrionectae TaxID=454601 RepID=A0A2R4MHI4_9HYPH|nr:2-hydroxyacid dehydrogenase [Maritalea myrionectae]AVX05364.1 gluconate 2-dehydrogenase [Maritalea myrionectae]
MKNILIAGHLPQDCLNLMGQHFSLYRMDHADNKEQFLAEHAHEIEGVSGGAIDAALMDKLPNLKIIANFGVGYDNIDVEAAKARNIVVTNTPNRLNAAVAELTLGLMIALARRIPKNHEMVRNGHWPSVKRAPLTGQLAGAKLGILGLGRIGKAVAKRAEACDMEISYFGRTDQQNDYLYFDDLTAMARHVDWLVIIAPGGEGTDKLVSAEVIEALGPDGHLVNVARGSIVDEPAMIAALEQGKLGGAALDVFENEPHMPDTLRNLPNVVLSPHAGSATRVTRQQMGAQVVDNLVAFFDTGKALDPVT